MAIRDYQVLPQVITDAGGTPVRVAQMVPQWATNATAAPIRCAQVLIQVVRTLGCAAIPIALPTAQHRVIRRVRRTPHLSAHQVRQFFARFQLDLQTGTGLTTGQGSDPLVCLRWSDNGGHTWSHDHLVEAGKVGQYARRAIWRRLGTGRDRVFEISVSDPVAWRILDAYLDAELGSE